MWFVDQAKIMVAGGDGGRGCSSLAQPPYTRAPVPDGGDGGDGGNVIARSDPNLSTLLDFHFRHEFTAGRGRHGSGNTRAGKRGADVLVRVPVGTVIHDVEAGTTLCELLRPNEDVTLAKGGRGGLGNATLWKMSRVASRAKSRDATEGEAQPGTPGERRTIRLELKLIADVGIIGFPNAGKSSLLARISTARPKIGAYPFTTRYPVLGVVHVQGRGSFVACDIPGLIEQAHAGKGLGIQFLRHIERTRALIHLVDVAALDGRDPAQVFHQVNHELAAYNETLLDKPQLIAANKLDLPEALAKLEAFQRAVQERVWPISCATGEGIPALLQAVWERLHARSHAGP